MVLIILPLLFVVTNAYITNVTDYGCVTFGKICDPFLLLPCCNLDNQCKRMGWSAMKNTYMCIKSSNLNRRCKYNLDCSNVDFTECVDNRCKCLPDYVKIDSFTCGTYLGGFCEKNETCIVHNSACVDNKCQCKSPFVAKTKGACIPTPLGKECTKDFDCNAVGDAKCSDQHKCICKDNYVEINNATCKPLLGEFCKKDNDCTVHNSICMDYKCQCKNKFISKSNNECIPTPLQKFCYNDDDCLDILHAKCSKSKRCICRENYDEINDTTCEPPLGEFCWKNDRCAVTNSICYDNECQCKSSYVPLSKNECIKSPVGSDCLDDADCASLLKQTKCSQHKKCICEEDVVSEDGVSCLQILGDYCYNDSQCGPRYSSCINRKCQCQHIFKAVSSFKCNVYYS